MFIPNIKIKLNIGDDIILKEDLELNYGTFTKGHLFKIINIKNNGGLLDIIDENGIILTNTPLRYFVKNITHDESKEMFLHKQSIRSIKYEIRNQCKYKSIDYENYTRFERCDLSKNKIINKFDNECIVKLECILHNSDLCKKYPNISRKYKIEKLIYNKK